MRSPGGGLARLCLAAVVGYASYALCRTPLLPLFAQELGAGPAMIGVAVGASTVTGILVKLPAGALSDVLGRRPLLLAGSAVFALMPFAYLAVASLAGLVLVRVLHGNATAIFGPVASATVADLAPADRRGRWLSGYATAQGAGQALGPLLAGYLLASGTFAPAFVAAGMIGLVMPAVLFGVAVAPPSPRAAPRWPAFRDGVREVIGNRLVLVTSAAHSAQFVLNGALNGFLPLYARDTVGLTITEIGWLFGAQTVTTLAIRPIVGAIPVSIGRRSVIVAGLSLCRAAVWTLSLASDGATLAACLLVYAAGVAATTSATSALVTDATRQARYGAAHGVFGTSTTLATRSDRSSAGVVVAAAGYGALFTGAAALGLAMALLFALASRPGKAG